MCCSHVSLSSTIIPRYLTHSVLFTSPPSTIIMCGVDSGFLSRRFKRCGVPMIVNSVFTVFRLSLLLFNHSQTFTKAGTSSSLLSQSIPTGYIPPEQLRGNFFERANPSHLGNFFCLIPCPRAKNDGRILRGWGKIFPNSKKLLHIKLAKVLEKLRRLGDSKTTGKFLNPPALIFS